MKTGYTFATLGACGSWTQDRVWIPDKIPAEYGLMPKLPENAKTRFMEGPSLTDFQNKLF